MWEKLGNKTRASKSSWPEAKDVQLGYDEMREDLFRRILDDISKILKVTKMSPKTITVYIAGAMKSDSYAYIVREVLAGSSNMGQIMPKLLSNPATQDIKKSPDLKKMFSLRLKRYANILQKMGCLMRIKSIQRCSQIL